jgi:protein SCO1/2
MSKAFITLVLVAIGFLIFQLLWPTSINLPKIGAIDDWPLTEVSGNETSILNKPKIIAFFYTNCPDICPTTMMDLKDVQQLLKDKGISENQYVIVAVTLDPLHDTQEKINQYKDAFGISSTNFLFLRDTEKETKKFTQYFNFTYKQNQDGFLTHTTSMYVVDSTNHIRALHDMAIGEKRVNIEEVANHLIQLIEE